MIESNQKIYMLSQLIGFKKLADLQSMVSDWLILIRILTTPTEIYLNDEKKASTYSIRKIRELIQTIDLQQEEPVRITLKNNHGEFFIQIYAETILERTVITSDIFNCNQSIIESYFTERMKQFGVYSYIRAYDEYTFNNQGNLLERGNETQDQQDQLPKMYDEDKNIIVDCNQLAGYDIFYRGLCFTSCWKMWFGPLYYRLIPKNILLEVQQVAEVIEYEQEIVEITLYQNPYDWNNPENQRYQQLFRDQIGADQFSWDNGIGSLREPYIEYNYTGHEINTVQYQNKYLQPTSKSQAKHFITRTENRKEGKAVERRKFGFLNSNAYFPWQDRKKKKMMNYRILNPLFSVDGGLKAYEFYIRQFLEVNVKDENYLQYTPILQLYIPKESIAEIPLETLESQMKDTQITNVCSKPTIKSFDIKKANNHLRVIFSEYEDLEKDYDIKDIHGVLKDKKKKQP